MSKNWPRGGHNYMVIVSKYEKLVFFMFEMLKKIHFVKNKRMSQQIGTFNFKNAGRVIKFDTSICILPHVLNVFVKTLIFYNKN